MKKHWICASLIACLCFTSCKKDDDVTATNDTTQQTTTLKTEVKTHYADLVMATYHDSYEEAVKLQTAINTFVDNPTEANHTAAKNAWLAAREPYGQTEAFRFYDGPIDDADGPEGLLNAWPLDEAYIDYVEGNATAGIINDTKNYPTIDAALIESLNESGGETNISVGYHAIEFLLWGQDLSAPSEKKSGQRAYTDFVTGDKGTASNQARRGTYLKVCTEQLVKHLKNVHDEWAMSGAYRTTFLALDNDVALQKIFTGIGILSKSELAGERIFTAYDNKDQEDEHSCFSDNTHRDIILNAQGIQNVYTGTYTKVDGSVLSGKSLSDLVKATNESLNTATLNLIDESVKNSESMSVPFDDAISTDGTNVLKTVTSLQSAGDKIAEAAKSLNITINTGLPE